MKAKVKKQLPVVIASTVSTAITAGVAALLYRKRFKTSLRYTDAEIEVVKTGVMNLSFEIDGGRYDLVYRGETE